ncbi:Gastric triacylglycerol lipase [Bienertia sinuspersici]
MMKRIVDNAIAITKESVKTITYESLNNIVRLINGISAILLAFLPGKASILEGLHGWELRPSFRGPRLPRWMGNGVSSFNQLIHELSVDSDTSSVEYSSGEEDDGYSSPASPRSQSSQASWTSSGREYDNHHTLIWYLLSWMLYPFTCLLGLPFSFYRLLFSREGKSSCSQQPSPLHSPRKLPSLRDHFVHRATDRRRGVIEVSYVTFYPLLTFLIYASNNVKLGHFAISSSHFLLLNFQDLHLGIEICIEAVFDAVHKTAHFLLSPSEAFRILSGWVFPQWSNDAHAHEPAENVLTTVLGEHEPAPSERKASFNPLNTDARTCQDVITELGYPYEVIHVVTDDGYILLLERIPRRDSRKAVYLQHGVLDSSMGYWRYSINEHGTKDIPAMIEKIHEVKTSELMLRYPKSEEDNSNEQPYNLCAICHSLGGAGILMYVITRLIEQKPHRFSRLILLSPAGFHDDSNFAFTVLQNLFLVLAPILVKIVPAFYIPTRFFRMLLNKLARDFHNYPAVGGLVQTLMSYVVGGDSSNWIGVLGLPHYNMNDMPGVAFNVALHMAQMKRSGKFRMFDYGNPDANLQVYGSPEPIDLGEFFDLIDIPVDLVAGRKDKVIRPSMVRKHYNLMKEAGVKVSYNEFEYAHLDFTFSHREELLAYVMSRLQLVKSTPKQQLGSEDEELKDSHEHSD